MRSYVSSKLFGNSFRIRRITDGKLRFKASNWQTTHRNLLHEQIEQHLQLGIITVGSDFLMTGVELGRLMVEVDTMEETEGSPVRQMGAYR